MLKALDAAKTKFSPIGECFSAEEAKEVRSLILAQAIISISNEIYAKSYGITPKAYSRIHTRDDFVTAAFSAILGEIGKRSWDGKAGVLSGMTAFDTLYYRGEWNGRSLPHGRGELIMANGDTMYKGEFVDGRIEGYGIQHFPNGNCYEGDFRSFRFNGKGKFTYASGTYYVGEFKDGQYDGEGKIYFKAGGTDEGQFKSGKLHGKGKRTFPDKSVDEGEFVDGKLTGKGRHIYTDGAVLEGTFFEGRITGLGRLTYCDGSVYKGNFFLGKPRGKGTKTYPDGRVYEGSWRQGKLYGPAACRFPDGGCFSGTFSFGMLQGAGKYTFADGSYCESDSFGNNFRSADSAVYTDLNGNIQHGRLEDGVFIPDETPSVQE